MFGFAKNTTSDGPSSILRPLYNGLRFALGPSEMFFFKDILFLGSHPIVIPIANFDHEGVELSH